MSEHNREQNAASIVCGSSVCPICEQPTTALFGPCDSCDWYFRKWRRWPRKRRTHIPGADRG